MLEPNAPAAVEVPAPEPTFDQLRMGVEEAAPTATVPGEEAPTPSAGQEAIPAGTPSPSREEAPAGNEQLPTITGPKGEELPAWRVQEITSDLREAKAKLDELNKYRENADPALKWVQWLAANPDIRDEVLKAIERKKLERENPDAAKLPDDDPTKELKIKLGQMEKALNSVLDRDQQTAKQREQEGKVQEIQKQLLADWQDLYKKADQSMVKLLKNPFHMKNIFRWKAEPGEKRTVAQLAVAYFKELPGVSIPSSYLESKKGPVIGTKSGGTPPPVDRTKKLTFGSDPAEIEAAINEKLAAINQG